ncbi:hypothetical protein F4815DRAFT_492449 [Daldinia loculata]|nr:hypothetical protein F4815DRAFT_492449 [Daldinia loculata]
MRPPMRSSIACTRCRKSKIKCENTGGTNPCDGCIKTGKQCIFKLPEPAPPKRAEPPTLARQERDGGSDRKKLKKIDEISKGDNQKASVYAEEVLSAPFLTEDLWEQVLDLYKLHFAPELPFLHLPTMKEKLGRKFKNQQSDGNPDLNFNLVLLGVLTLTARFHPDLVKYLAHICSNQPGNARTRPVQTPLDPATASEYYADVLTMALGPIRTAMKTASVERVAALLMLGLYEWSQTLPRTGGLGAWMYVGLAIRMAQYLGLGFSDSPDSPDSPDDQSKSLSQKALEKEVRRRTMFSCFILDRMLSCEDIKIQLPCSEDKFDLAMEARTGFLRDRGRHGMDDNIWGEISKFSSSGGRLNEKEKEHPPWTKGSTFYQLSEKLAEFDAELPDTFTFSRSNYFKHENHQASSVYVLLHMLRCVCLIMLHREYIPFVPVRCKEPEGPLDKPIFQEDKFGPPPKDFWMSSAEQICQRKDKLPQSTIVLFAIWTASFMDTEKHMLEYDFETTRQSESASEVFRRGSVAFAFMASTYVLILRQMDDYFGNIKRDYYKFATKNRGNKERPSRVREGGTGGGLKDFGFLQIEGENIESPHRTSPSPMPSRGMEAPDTSTKSKTPKLAPPGSFTAINHTPVVSAPDHPPLQVYTTSEELLDTTALATEAHDRLFWDNLKKEEPRRIGTIGDLGYFSSGDSQLPMADMPFGDSALIHGLPDSSFQYLQQMAEF